MNRVEMNQFNMMQDVDQFFTINQSVFSGHPAIVKSINELKLVIGDIKGISQMQAVRTKAESTIKADIKSSLIDGALKVAGGMSAHAAATGDTRLKINADVTFSDLNKMRETDFTIKIRAIYDTALPIAEALEVWGVTQADIDGLNTGIEDFTTQSPVIRNLKAKTKQATSGLKTKFDEGNDLIKNTLDPMMLPFKNLNPTLHGEYMNARAIIDRRATQTQTPPPPKEA